MGSVLGGDSGERHREVVAQPEFGQVSGFHPVPAKGSGQSLAAVEHPVDELIPFLAVLPEERREALHRRGFEGHEAVRGERFLNPAERFAAGQGGGGQVVPHPADRLGGYSGHERRGAYWRSTTVERVAFPAVPVIGRDCVVTALGPRESCRRLLRWSEGARLRQNPG